MTKLVERSPRRPRGGEQAGDRRGVLARGYVGKDASADVTLRSRETSGYSSSFASNRWWTSSIGFAAEFSTRTCTLLRCRGLRDLVSTWSGTRSRARLYLLHARCPAGAGESQVVGWWGGDGWREAAWMVLPPFRFGLSRSSQGDEVRIASRGADGLHARETVTPGATCDILGGSKWAFAHGSGDAPRCLVALLRLRDRVRPASQGRGARHGGGSCPERCDGKESFPGGRHARQ